MGPSLLLGSSGITRSLNVQGAVSSFEAGMLRRDRHSKFSHENLKTKVSRS